MKIQNNLMFVAVALSVWPMMAMAEDSPNPNREPTALSTSDDYVNAGSIIRKDDKHISILDDLLTINGTFRVRVDSQDTAANNSSSYPTLENTHSEFNSEFWVRARLYQDWKIVSQIEPNIDLETGKFRGDHDVPMNKLYAEGTVHDFGSHSIKARLGKFGAFSSYGRVWDTEVTGAEIFFDNKVLPTKVMAGRRTGFFNDNVWGIGGRRKHLVSVQSVYPINENINLAGTVSYMKDVDIGARKDAKNAVFGELGADVKLNDYWRWMGAVSRSNIKAYNDVGQKIENDGLFTQIRYRLADWEVRNSYDVFLNYRRVGSLSGVSSVEDYSKNVQGVQLGVNFVPWKNWKINAFYLHGKQVTATVGGNKQDVNVVRGQLEYKF